jgi:hypothetical protein
LDLGLLDLDGDFSSVEESGFVDLCYGCCSDGFSGEAAEYFVDFLAQFLSDDLFYDTVVD